MSINSSGLAEEILCAAMFSNSSFVLGYLVPFSSLSTSAADGAAGGCAVSVCRRSLDFCSNPLPQKGHRNCAFSDNTAELLPLISCTSLDDQIQIQSYHLISPRAFSTSAIFSK